MTSYALAKIIDCIPSNGIDFEYCGVQYTETKTFTLVNSASGLVHFEVVTDNSENKLFTIEPKNGKLHIIFKNVCLLFLNILTLLVGMMRAGHKQEITVTFSPQEAKVVLSTAIFKFQEGEKEASKVLKMSGIGKFPFVDLSHEKLDFEQLTVGKTLTKEIMLRNYSQVKARFEIEQINDDGKDNSFILSLTSDTINPGASKKITVTYSPAIVGQFTCTQYSINVTGGNTLKLSCQGCANGIDVSLSSKSIHFGEVQLTSTTNRLLNICNESDQPTTFQFFNDKNNIFSFSKCEGTIKPHSQARIIIEFFPQATKNYYERVFCIVRSHQVLYVDLIGACYDVLTKPMPLMQRHVDIYRHKVIMGIHAKMRVDKYGDAMNNSLM